MSCLIYLSKAHFIGQDAIQFTIVHCHQPIQTDVLHYAKQIRNKLVICKANKYFDSRCNQKSNLKVRKGYQTNASYDFIQRVKSVHKNSDRFSEFRWLVEGLSSFLRSRAAVLSRDSWGGCLPDIHARCAAAKTVPVSQRSLTIACYLSVEYFPQLLLHHLWDRLYPPAIKNQKQISGKAFHQRCRQRQSKANLHLLR